MAQRLELVWPNKDKVLLGLEEDGKPIWGTKADLEPRLLVQLEAVGKTNPDHPSDLHKQGDNLLIKGDNLLALRALGQHFTGKIKCIYIDPPFNTGNAFEHYDDGLEHTIWLSMMKSRLELLKRLLTIDGMLVVHIDHHEYARLKLLLDEVMGFQNYVDTLCLKVRHEDRILKGDKFTHNVIEYALIYARSRESFVIQRRERETDLSKYCYEVHVIGKGRSMEVGGKQVMVLHPQEYKIAKTEPSDRRLQMINIRGSIKEGNSSGRFYEKYLAPRLKADGYATLYGVPDMGADGLGIRYFLSPRNEHFRNGQYFQGVPIEGRSSREVPFANFLDITEPNNRVQEEGAVTFRNAKKTEILLKTLIELVSTSPNDWILDSFLGSGTTAAVAHKLRRKWIGIEKGDHTETHCLPRLKQVVSGEDPTGISEQVDWKGGGGFRYCVLGESLFARDQETGLVMINPKYNNGLLVSALCHLEEFALNDDGIFHGVRGNIYAHVTEEKVTQAYLDGIVDRLPPGKFLSVYCLKRTAGMRLPTVVQIKRIPKELQIPRYLMNGR